jgi:hypothetical protein
VTTWSRLERDKNAYINAGDAVEWLGGFWTKARALVGPPENMYDADEHPSVEN